MSADSMHLPGTEFFFDKSLGLVARLYCRVLGIPIIGLRIRLRRVMRLLPEKASYVLDAGCGRGVITRELARRYPGARIDGIDMDQAGQASNNFLAGKLGLQNCTFVVADVTEYQADARYDLVVSVDNLEHVADDRAALKRFYNSLSGDGMLVIHAPHYYRRWPLFQWSPNFDVPGHVRVGYHLPELVERVRNAGFSVVRSGFSYGFLENLINNFSYAITGARERNKAIIALLFPLLNVLAWLGQWSRPDMGAGVWLVAQKKESRKPVLSQDEDDDMAQA
jgi:SAM-dependent methyltransferase